MKLVNWLYHLVVGIPLIKDWVLLSVEQGLLVESKKPQKRISGY